MITQELIDYISQEIQSGKQREAVKHELLGIGWLESDIEEAFNTLSQKVPELPTPPTSGQYKPVLQLVSLTKSYGKSRGIIDVNLEVKKGEIFGFLGPNGSGKSTTIRTILHLLHPTSGKVIVFDKDVQKDYVITNGNIGYLPGDVSLYPKYTGKKLITMASAFYRKNHDIEYARSLIRRLKCEMNTPYKKLSKGNKQKIGILLALFHRPDLLVLDEPTSGLDPLTMIEFYKILFELKESGTTIFFSSHNLAEVEKICDRVGIIREGRLAAVETIQALSSKRKKIVEATFEGDIQIEEFENLNDVKVIESRSDYIKLSTTGSAMDSLIKKLAKHNVKDVNVAYQNLEQVFLDYYNGTKHDE